MDATQLADLTDAVARGRLTLAELATLNSEELDALHAVAVARLDTGRHDDARILLAALTTLFPYRARFWRTFGVALQRCGDLHHAVAAYDAALLLDPGHGMTLLHRAESMFLLGEQEKSSQTIFRLLDDADAAVASRASALWQVVSQARRPVIPIPATPFFDATITAELDGFTLTDGRTLPLEVSRFGPPPTAPEPMPPEEGTEPNEVIDRYEEEVPREITQSVHRTNTAAVSPLPEGTGGTGGSGTPKEPTVITAVERRVHGWPLTDDEITLTAAGPEGEP